MCMFDRKYSWCMEDPSSCPPSSYPHTALSDGSAAAPPRRACPGRLGPLLTVGRRQAALPLRAFGWHSDVLGALSLGRSYYRMAEGSTDLPGPRTPYAGRPCLQGGRARVVANDNPRPPRRPSEHIGRAGREKQEDRNQVELVEGSVFQI